jgi:hypothetical protein
MMPTASDVLRIGNSMTTGHEHEDNDLPNTTSCPSEAENIDTRHTTYGSTTSICANSRHVITCKCMINTLENSLLCLALHSPHANNEVLRTVFLGGGLNRKVFFSSSSPSTMIYSTFDINISITGTAWARH